MNASAPPEDPVHSQTALFPEKSTYLPQTVRRFSGKQNTGSVLIRLLPVHNHFTFTHFPTLALSKSGYGSKVTPSSQPVNKLPDVLFHFCIIDLLNRFFKDKNNFLCPYETSTLSVFLARCLTGAVKAWVKRIEILGVELLLNAAQGFTETGRLK